MVTFTHVSSTYISKILVTNIYKNQFLSNCHLSTIVFISRDINSILLHTELLYMGSDYTKLLIHTEVRRLFRRRILSRFFQLKHEICINLVENIRRTILK